MYLAPKKTNFVHLSLVPTQRKYQLFVTRLGYWWDHDMCLVATYGIYPGHSPPMLCKSERGQKFVAGQKNDRRGREKEGEFVNQPPFFPEFLEGAPEC